MDETTSTDSSSGPGIVEEIEAAVRQAAGNQKVLLIRIAVGKGTSVSRIEIAKELHRRFPHASLELSDAAEADSVVVKDIEVE